MRVLLVHANPFQRVQPVPPYGLERLRTALEPLGVQVEILDPYLVASDPLAAAAAAAARLQPDVIGLGLRIVDDCIVVDRLEAPEHEPIDVSWFMPEIRRLKESLRRAAPDAAFVLGGAAFSAFPHECLDYLEVDYGVVGAGELVFPRLLEQLRGGRVPAAIPGLARRGDPCGGDAYALAPVGPTRREPLYVPVNGFAVRTRIGCAMECVYCVTANLRRRHGDGDVAHVLDEIEATVAAGRGRGLSVVHLFFADDEFNLPGERHAVAVLRGILERGLEQRLAWRAYFNPTPFSDELAELVAATNGRTSITVDTAAEAVMARARKPFRRRHLDALVERLERRRVPADLGLIFGLPGETETTVDETVAFVRALPPSIEVVYSCGARVYPHTPLAGIAAREPERLVGAGDPTFFAPVVYSSPWPPRELARRLEAAFTDLPHVRRVGAGYRSGRPTIAAAYRTVLAGAGRREWTAVLDSAESGEYGRTAEELLASCMQVAVWHGRFDLAGAACGRLLGGRRSLPAGISRRRLRMARLGFAVLGAVGRGSRTWAPAEERAAS